MKPNTLGRKYLSTLNDKILIAASKTANIQNTSFNTQD